MDDSVLPAIRRLEDTHWWFRARLDLIEAVTNRTVADGARVLDIGCGTGAFLARIQGRFDAYGVDSAEAAITYCHSRGIEKVRNTTIEMLPEAFPGSFDAVTMWDVLEHIENDALALDRVRQALTPSGVLLLTVPAYPWLWSSHDVLHHHYRRYTRGSLLHRLTESGFVARAAFYFNSYLLPFAVVQRIATRILGGSSAADVPPAFVNNLFLRIFGAERKRVAGPDAAGFPAGLSVLAIASPVERR